MKKLFVCLLAMVFVVPLMAFDLPNVYMGAAYDSREGIVSGVASDVIGKWGLSLAVGALDKRGPMGGLFADIGYLAKKAKLNFFYDGLNVIKIGGYGSYSLTDNNWSGGIFGAVISIDLP